MGKQRKKLDPYSRFGHNKFEHDEDQRVTKASKEEIKNANRSLKKGKRQEYKNALKQFMEGYQHGNE